MLAPSASAKLRVSGGNLVDNGRVVQLLGVNRSGTEYMCKEGFGDVFDGPSNQASVTAMRSWGINTVRVPLNESCWLGVGKLRKYTKRYRAAIVRYVRLLRRNHLYVILDDHFSAPGRRIARDLLAMPTPRTRDFWRSVARRYRRSNGVLFDLYNEPHGVSWRCWLHGCRVSRRKAPPSNRTYPAYRAVGMRSLLRTVRRTGARQIVLLGGLGYSRDLTQWLRYRPRDPPGSSRPRSTPTGRPPPGWPPSASAPVATTWSRSSGASPWSPARSASTTARTATSTTSCPSPTPNGISYLGWTWDALAPGGWQCDTGPALIQNYDGTPTPFGVGLRDHLRAR